MVRLSEGWRRCAWLPKRAMASISCSSSAKSRPCSALCAGGPSSSCFHRRERTEGHQRGATQQSARPSLPRLAVVAYRGGKQRLGAAHEEVARHVRLRHAAKQLKALALHAILDAVHLSAREGRLQTRVGKRAPGRPLGSEAVQAYVRAGDGDEVLAVSVGLDGAVRRDVRLGLRLAEVARLAHHRILGVHVGIVRVLLSTRTRERGAFDHTAGEQRRAGAALGWSRGFEPPSAVFTRAALETVFMVGALAVTTLRHECTGRARSGPICSAPLYEWLERTAFFMSARCVDSASARGGGSHTRVVSREQRRIESTGR